MQDEVFLLLTLKKRNPLLYTAVWDDMGVLKYVAFKYTNNRNICAVICYVIYASLFDNVIYAPLFVT